MIDTAKCVIRQLEVAGSPVDKWDHVIVFVLISRMPTRTLTYWENSNDLIEMPTLQNVLDFLERRARSQVNFAQSMSQSSSSNQSSLNESRTTASSSFKSKQKLNAYAKSNDRQSLVNNSNEQRGVSCFNCQLPHPMFRCAKLLALPTEGRWARVKELRLCENCFSPNHRAGSMS